MAVSKNLLTVTLALLLNACAVNVVYSDEATDNAPAAVAPEKSADAPAPSVEAPTPAPAAPLNAPPLLPSPQVPAQAPTPLLTIPQPAPASREETFVTPGWTITVRPECDADCVAAVVAAPLRPTYEQAYASVPFRRHEYEANPGYRHDAAMELMFGTMRPTTVVRQSAPMINRSSDFWLYRLGLDRRQPASWMLQNWQYQPWPRLLYY